MLDSIKTELEVNELLLEDFPEACYPITRLEGIAHRCIGQTCGGERTHIGWSSNELVMPTIPGSRASGAIVKVLGITGGIRGMKFKRPDGKTSRPSLVVIDDPQTDQSARSPSQCESRERILAGAILGLAGPGKKISGIMPCTVIRAGDMADAILDRGKHPEWNGTRTKMVYSFPTAEKLWEEYGRIRDDSFRAGNAGREATEFYLENRSAMDAGSQVAWPARHNPDEISAIQHAMNLKLMDERAFHSEYQNSPLMEKESRSDDLTPDQVASRVNRATRGSLPTSVQRVTGFIDVHGSLLYYVICGWEDDFTGYVIDYGTFPEQKTDYFQLSDAKITYPDVIKAAGLEGLIRGALDQLSAKLAGREWHRDDGAALRAERILVDANWGQMTDSVYRFCRESPFGAILTPSHGKYIGASGRPMGEEKRNPGDKVGLGWKLPAGRGKREIRRCLYDTNFWKSFVHSRLSTALGDKGAMTLFGANPGIHRLFSDHLCSEFRVRTEGRGREVDEWKHRPERADNHFFDCLVGATVAASIQGVTLQGPVQQPALAKPEKKRYSFAELQRQKHGQQQFPG